MSASTSTVSGAPGIRRVGAAIVAGALALTLAAIVAFGALTAFHAQVAPAAAPAPATWDHGTSLGGSDGTPTWDHGTSVGGSKTPDVAKGLNGTSGRRFYR